MGGDFDPIGFLSGRSTASKAGDLSQQGYSGAISGIQDFMKTLQPLYQQYMDVGKTGTEGMKNLMEGGFTKDPVFQQIIKSGTQASNMNAAGSGHLFSGGQGKALQAYGEKEGANYFDDIFKNYQSMSNTGLTATQSLTSEQTGLQGMLANLFTSKGKDASQAEMAKGQGMQDLVKTGIEGAAKAFSDRRLKRNIQRVGTHDLGIGVYEFDYLWGAHAVGFMADEVEQVMPEAVGEINGYKFVNYGMIQGE